MGITNLKNGERLTLKVSASMHRVKKYTKER